MFFIIRISATRTKNVAGGWVLMDNFFIAIELSFLYIKRKTSRHSFIMKDNVKLFSSITPTGENRHGKCFGHTVSW